MSADASPAQKVMPMGMLMPVDASLDGAQPDDAGSRMRVAHGMKSGAWIELQIAKAGDRPDRAEFVHFREDSPFVSLEAMTALHEAFARALPGFDLLLPRLFSPEALATLDRELEALAQRSSGEVAVVAREVAQVARSMAAKNQSVWVLGP